LRLTPKNRKLALAGLAYFLVATIAVTGYFIFLPIFKDPLDQDTVFVVMGARIGLEQGWNHLYAIDIQRQYYAMLRPGAPFDQLARYLHPPPLAIMSIPLTLLTLQQAFWTFMVIETIALVAAWYLVAPGRGWGLARICLLLGAFAWYPVLYQLRTGQPVMLVVIALAGCWKLAEAKKPWLAGVVLALAVVKPQLTLLVAPCLLLAGHWRIAAAWAATAGVLAIASLALIGPGGLKDYLSLLDFAKGIVFNRYFTLAYIFGLGPAATIAQVAVAVLTLAAAFRLRGAPLARIIPLGVVGSMLSIPYDHLHDFAVLVPAALLFLRTEPPSWQRAWLLVVWISMELAWPIRPLPLLLSQAVWLAMIALPGAFVDPHQVGLDPHAQTSGPLASRSAFPGHSEVPVSQFVKKPHRTIGALPGSSRLKAKPKSGTWHAA
jgi:Glycosyltransferase family 87